MKEYRCVVHIRYPSLVSAPSVYESKDKVLINLGYELIKDGLVNYIDTIECEEEE